VRARFELRSIEDSLAAGRTGTKKTVTTLETGSRAPIWWRPGGRRCPQASGTGSRRLHNGSKNWVDLGGTEKNPGESMKTSKVPRVSSLTGKTRLLADFSKRCCTSATPGASTTLLQSIQLLRAPFPAPPIFTACSSERRVVRSGGTPGASTVFATKSRRLVAPFPGHPRCLHNDHDPRANLRRFGAAIGSTLLHVDSQSSERCGPAPRDLYSRSVSGSAGRVPQ
jgi:hypothetical protein